MNKKQFKRNCEIIERKNVKKVYCPICGHTNVFMVRKSHLCSYCKHLVYPTKEVEFNEKLCLALRKIR